ncbi:MAG: hypothetical protein GX310_02200 [Synergistaceae bacterium]|nr:hypothetical protein [Synergistaceae bacterium]
MKKRARVLIAVTAALILGAAIWSRTSVKERDAAYVEAADRALRAAGIALELAEAVKPHLEFLSSEDRAVVAETAANLAQKGRELAALAEASAVRAALEVATGDLERLLSEIISDYRPGAYQEEGSVSP